MIKGKPLELETHLKGVRIKSRERIYLSPPIVNEFYSLAKNFANLEFQRKALEKEQGEIREKMIKIARECKFEGIVSEEDNFSLSIFQREKISWNREILKKH